MVCMRVAFHENNRNHDTEDNDEDELNSYKQGFECWVDGNHGNDASHGNRGCKPWAPQTTGVESGLGLHSKSPEVAFDISRLRILDQHHLPAR